jgi:hypothetical protein
MLSSIFATKSEAMPIAAFLGDCDEPRRNEFRKVLARGGARNSREKSELAAGQGLPAHQCRENGGPRGIPDKGGDLDQICCGDHSQAYCSRSAMCNQPQFGTYRTDGK